MDMSVTLPAKAANIEQVLDIILLGFNVLQSAFNTVENWQRLFDGSAVLFLLQQVNGIFTQLNTLLTTLGLSRICEILGTC